MRQIVILGSANMDLVLPVTRLPKAGETLAGGELTFHPGGKGANQACASARAGARTSIIAEVGNDAFGEALVTSLRAAGVDVSGVGRSENATGCAVICVLPNGENSIIISPGANSRVAPESVADRLECLTSGDFLLLQLEIPLDAVNSALEAAKAKGCITILDPAPARMLPPAMLSNVDFLTPNQSEASALLGSSEILIESSSDAESAANRLLELGAKFVVLKMGESGCYLAGEGVRAHVAAFPVAAVDTTAAGDVFNGAFAAALALGRPVIDAANFASAAAAISVTRPGAQGSIPSLAEIDCFLKDHACS